MIHHKFIFRTASHSAVMLINHDGEFLPGSVHLVVRDHATGRMVSDMVPRESMAAGLMRAIMCANYSGWIMEDSPVPVFDRMCIALLKHGYEISTGVPA